MATLIAYRKVITITNTHELRMPYSRELGGPQGNELATLADGRTVVCIDDGATLPDQPAEIAASIETLPSPLPAELRAEILATSPHAKLINQRVVERIRARYSVDDEIKLLRFAPSAETTAWNDHVEACRAWGRAERARLGL